MAKIIRNDVTYSSDELTSVDAPGLCPQLNGSTSNYLRGDGSWITPPNDNTTYGTVTTSNPGLCPTLAGGTAKYLRADGSWITPPNDNTTYGTVTTSNPGLCPKLGGGTTNFLRADGSWATPAYPTVNNATLTIQRNSTTVKTFTANASSNVTANIECEPPITWTYKSSTGSWNYWKDNSGRYHMTYNSGNQSINFNGTIGSLKYRTTTFDLTPPFTMTSLHSIVASTCCANDLTGVTVQSYTTNSIKLYLWAATAGTKTVSIHMDIITT